MNNYLTLTLIVSSLLSTLVNYLLEIFSHTIYLLTLYVSDLRSVI